MRRAGFVDYNREKDGTREMTYFFFFHGKTIGFDQ